MISANGGLPAHRYTPEVTQRWPRGSEPASEVGSHGCSDENGEDKEHELGILRGCNLTQFCKQQREQNSAPNVWRLPEKPLKTLLTHQNDHRGQKKGKFAFLEFHSEHFKG